MTVENLTFTLSKPLKTHSGELTTLTLREPIGGSYVDLDEPFYAQNEGGDASRYRLVYNNKVMFRWIMEMITEPVDEIIVKSMPASDYFGLRTLATELISSGAGSRNPT